MLSTRGLYYSRVGVIGVGLMGGSFAAALKSEDLVGEVIGCDRSREHLRVAEERGFIDTRAELAEVAGCPLIVLAAPVCTNLHLLRKLADRIPEDSSGLVMDLGSTKRSIVEEAEHLLPKTISFIGGHPMAGSECDGPQAASAGLFRDRPFILIPGGGAAGEVVLAARRLVTRIGGRPVLMEAGEHDRVMAAVSHLPHVVASGLMLAVGELDGEYPEWEGLVGEGLLDSTRISGGEPEMWGDISLDNRRELLSFLRIFREKLEAFEGSLESGNKEDLKKFFCGARILRRRFRRD